MVNKLTTPPSQNELIEKTNEIIDALADSAQLNYYGTCATAAATQVKVVDCEGFVLKIGVSIRVKFTNAQTYNGAPTLNVNSTGAISVKSIGTTNSVRYCWLAGEIVSFTYDGTYWVMEDAGIASTTYYGYTKLTTSAYSTNSSTALTPVSLNNYSQYMVSGAPVYSSSATYEVGDRVRYNYQTWECNTAITTPETWNAEHWTALDPLQTQINNKQDKLVSATNIKTINGNSLLGSGDISIEGGSSNIFIAEWDNTTYAEVQAAYDSGKFILCYYYDANNVGPTDLMLPLIGYNSNNDAFVFSGIYETTSFDVELNQYIWSGLNTTDLGSSAVSGANVDLSNLSTIGDNKVNTVLDQNTSAQTTRLKFWTGTKAQYDTIGTKNSNTLYYLTDTGKIYKGTTLIADKTTLYSSTGQNTDGAMTQQAVTDEIYYKAGDSETNYKVTAWGHLTSSKSNLYLSFPLDKKIPEGCTIDITSFIAQVRGAGGTITISSLSAFSSFGVNTDYSHGQTVLFYGVSSTLFASATNNSCYEALLTLNFDIIEEE